MSINSFKKRKADFIHLDDTKSKLLSKANNTSNKIKDLINNESIQPIETNIDSESSSIFFYMIFFFQFQLKLKFKIHFKTTKMNQT